MSNDIFDGGEVNYQDLCQIFQIEDPEIYCMLELDKNDPRLETYYDILNGYGMNCAKHIAQDSDAHDNITLYVGISARDQQIVFIRYSTPDVSEPRQHLAMLLFDIQELPNKPKAKGARVYFAAEGQLIPAPQQPDTLQFHPVEIKCRNIMQDDSAQLISYDVTSPTTLKAGVCYADDIFRSFLDDSYIDIEDTSLWMMSENKEVALQRFGEIKNRTSQELMAEIDLYFQANHPPEGCTYIDGPKIVH